jgi:hypothetical protein
MTQNRSHNVADFDRINLRLPAETFAQIDALRADRAGRISRNTWITEAIEEKMARDAVGIATPSDRKTSNA